MIITKIGSGSGASTKINFMLGAWDAVVNRKGFKPDIWVGISADAILGLFKAMGKWQEAREVLRTITLNKMFDKKPVTEKGKPTVGAMWRMTLGNKHYMGTQGGVLELIKANLSRYEFEAYKQNSEMAPVFVGYVRMKQGDIVYKNLKDLSYEGALDAIMASSSIPVFTSGVEIGGDLCFDGGNIDHNGSAHIASQFGGKGVQLVSVYSRTHNYDISDDSWEHKNSPFVVLNRAIEIFNRTVSLDDEKLTDKIVREKGMTQRKIFTPYILSDSTYQVTPELNEEWFGLGFQATLDNWKPVNDGN